MFFTVLLLLFNGCTTNHLQSSYNIPRGKYLKALYIVKNHALKDVTIKNNEPLNNDISALLKKVDKYSYYKRYTMLDYLNLFFWDEKIKSTIIGKNLQITIPYFYKNSSLDLAKEIKNRDKDITSIEIDLRGNKGGLMKEALKSLDLFLDEGKLVSIQKRTIKQTFFANKKNTLTKLPLKIMVDKETASSSELFAGVLQEKKRAKLFGERTYGKPYVQSLIYLDKSKEDYIMLTTGMFILPSGKIIHNGLDVD